MYGAENKGDQHGDNRRIVNFKSHREPLRPCPMGMACSDYALSKDQIDNKEQNDTRSDEYLCRNSNVDVGHVCTPNKPHGHGRYACHTEAKKKARHDKLLSSLYVDLEDDHVCYCSDDEQSQEDGCDWIIEGLCGRSSKTSGRGRIWGVQSMS